MKGRAGLRRQSEETGAVFTLNGDLVNMGTIASGQHLQHAGQYALC